MKEIENLEKILDDLVLEIGILKGQVMGLAKLIDSSLKLDENNGLFAELKKAEAITREKLEIEKINY